MTASLPVMAKPELQAQVVVVLLELRGVLKYVWGGGSIEGAAFDELRDRAYAALSGYLRRAEGPFRLGFALPEVLLDGQLLRGTRAAYEAAYELGRQLEELGGTELTIAPELTSADFTRVVEAIGKARRDVAEFSSPSPAFVLRASSDGHDVDDHESAEHVAHAYAASVVAMRHLLAELEGTALLPPRAKRVGHGLVDLSGARLSLLTAAASARGTGNEPAGRAVNAAVYALALMRQISSDRRLLSHVAMAALLCEVGHADDGSGAGEHHGAVPARTVAALMALGRLNEASVVRTVVAFETHWLESGLGPVYAGRRRSTLAARVLRVVRRYQALVAADESASVSARIDALYTQSLDEIEQLLTCALAAALQVPQPAASLDPLLDPPAEEAIPTSLAATAEYASALALVAHDSPPPSSVLKVVDSGWSMHPPPSELQAAPASEVEAAPGPAPIPEAAPTLRPGSGRETAPTPSAVPPPRRRPTAQGNLAAQPIPHVLLYALDQGLTGTLVFEEPAAGNAEPVLHQVFLLDGAPAQARLSLRVSRLGEVLARLGLVSSAHIESWLAQAAAKPGTPEAAMLLGELLLSKSVLSKEDLSRALEAQLVERLAALAKLPKGTTYSFYADENLFADQPGASELLSTSPLNALFATLRGSVDDERMMATLKRIWRIPLAFHPDADREAYALTGEEEAVLERIERGRPTIDELLADRRVLRPAAIQFVYFLAVTRQLTWKGQKKGPILPRGARPKSVFSPPLPPRIAPLPDDGRVLSGLQSTKPRIRVRILTPSGSRTVEASMPTPAVMRAVRLDGVGRPGEGASVAVPHPADSGYDVDVDVDSDAPEVPTADARTAEYRAAPSNAARFRSDPPVDFDHPNVVDPGAALVALVTALRLDEEGDRDGASRSVRHASTLDPDEPEYAARLARLERPRPEGVQTRLEKLRAEHPGHLVVELEWSRQQREHDNLQSALDGYGAILARDIAHAEAARSVFELHELLDDAAPASV